MKCSGSYTSGNSLSLWKDGDVVSNCVGSVSYLLCLIDYNKDTLQIALGNIEGSNLQC